MYMYWKPAMRKRVLRELYQRRGLLAEEEADPVVLDHEGRERDEPHVERQESREEGVDGDVEGVRELDTVVGDPRVRGGHDHEAVRDEPEHEGDGKGDENEVA